MAVPVLAGYWGLDLETRELLLCPRSRQMFGLVQGSRKRLAAYDWQARIHPDDMPVVRGEFETARRNNDVYAARFRTVHLDGSTCEVLGVGRVSHKNPKRFVGLNFDLRATVGVAERQSRIVEAAMSFASSKLPPARPTNENDPRPWHAWSLRSAMHPCSKRTGASTERRLLARRAEAMLDSRQLRNMFLSPAMFGEPAFDLLLALYMPSGSKSTMTAQALSELIGATLAVTVRWLKFLVNEGLVLTLEGPEADPPGAMTAALTDKARVTLDEYFKTASHLS